MMRPKSERTWQIIGAALKVPCDRKSEHHLLLPVVQPWDAADVALPAPVGCVECVCRRTLAVPLPLLLRFALLTECVAD